MVWVRSCQPRSTSSIPKCLWWSVDHRNWTDQEAQALQSAPGKQLTPRPTTAPAPAPPARVPVWLALHAANPSDVVAANTAPPFTSSSALKVHHPIRLRNHIQVVKSAAEQVGCAVKPSHGQTLLSRRSMTSCVVPVSPILGKTRVMLWAWASPCKSVMASVARVTLKPNS
jgi:hypothetical protein